MRRREFITLIGGAAVTWPLAARAQQQERIAHIGYLSLASPPLNKYDEAFVAGLRELGYLEGKNLHIEYRFTEDHEDRIAGLMAELIGLKVDVIVTYATAVYEAKRAIATVPVVFPASGDVVAMGLVSSLAHPGGNITGLTFFLPELMAKRLELLKEAVPLIAQAGVLLARGSDPNVLRAMETMAKALKVRLHPIPVGEVSEFENAFSTLADARIGGLVVIDHSLFSFNAKTIAVLAAKYRFPSVGPLELPRNGGLMGYGVDFVAMFHRAAYFVDKVLKGEKPGDIPIEQATKFSLVLNLKTAKTLGITFAPTLQVTADEVIE
jgi:putative ABC transport system substrate-binding protein